MVTRPGYTATFSNDSSSGPFQVPATCMSAVATFWRAMMPSVILTSGNRLVFPRLQSLTTMNVAHIFAAGLFQDTFAHDSRSPAAWERFRQGILEYGAAGVNCNSSRTTCVAGCPIPERCYPCWTLRLKRYNDTLRAT